MPRVRHHRRRHLGAVLAAGTAIGIGIGVYVGSHTGVTPPLSGTANVWAAPNGRTTAGGNCVRTAAIANPDTGGTTLCKTWQLAYQQASLGDTVGVFVPAGQPGFTKQNMSYTVAKAAGSHCDWTTGDYSGCITFASSGTVTMGGLVVEAPYVRVDGGAAKGFVFDRTSTVATSNSSVCVTPPSAVPTGGTCTYGDAQIRIGDVPQSGSYNCLGDATGGLAQEQPHDIVITNIQSNDTLNWAGPQTAAVTSSVFDEGSAARPNNGTSQISACRTKTGNPWQSGTDLLLDGVTFQNLLGTIYPSDQAGCTSWTCFHVANIHLNQGVRVTVRNSKFLNLCCHDIEGEACCTPSSDWTFTNNVFDYACSHQTTIGAGGTCGTQNGTLDVGCHDSSLVNATVSFNTFLGDPATATSIPNPPSWKFGVPGGCTGGATLSGTLRQYGNVWMDGNITAGTCTNLAAGGISVYDEVWWSDLGASTTNCGTGSVVGDPLIAGISSYDGTLGGGSPALSLVPTGVTGGCPATNILGVARGAGGFCNAGAY